MAPEIKESDWKVFRRLHQVALERFCRRVIEELRAATSNCGDNYHKCYLHIFELIRRRDKELGIAFDDPRRSSAFILLANIYEMGVLKSLQSSVQKCVSDSKQLIGSAAPNNLLQLSAG